MNMRCERCQSKGYAYCFHYPHPTPIVHIVGMKKMVEIIEYEVKGMIQ